MAGVERHTDAHWGVLSVDNEALVEKLAVATRAVYEASITAQYRNESGYPIQSPMSLILGGLSQAIDGLIEQLDRPEREGR